MAIPQNALALRHHDKDMSAVYDVPVTPLVIPISVLMCVPIHMVIVVVSMRRRASSSVDHSAARAVYHLGGVRFLERCGHGTESAYQQ
jgi:hypothetical protein